MNGPKQRVEKVHRRPPTTMPTNADERRASEQDELDLKRLGRRSPSRSTTTRCAAVEQDHREATPDLAVQLNLRATMHLGGTLHPSCGASCG
jgi:hypothetical protein